MQVLTFMLASGRAGRCTGRGASGGTGTGLPAAPLQLRWARFKRRSAWLLAGLGLLLGRLLA